MIRAAFAALGRILLLLATLVFVAALSIFVAGTFILTWPVLRLNPRDRKLKATMNLASSAMTLFTVLGEAKARDALVEALDLAAREGVMDDELDEVEPSNPASPVHEAWLAEQILDPEFRAAFLREIDTLQSHADDDGDPPDGMTPS